MYLFAKPFHFRNMKRYVMKTFLCFKWKALCFLPVFCFLIILITRNSKMSEQDQSFIEQNSQPSLRMESESQVLQCSMDNCFDSSRCSQLKVFTSLMLYTALCIHLLMLSNYSLGICISR